MQYYDRFDCDCNQISNIVTQKCLGNSSYVNYLAIFSNLIMLAEFRNSTSIIKNVEELNKEHILLGINVNNKIYIFDEGMMKNLFLSFDKDCENFLMSSSVTNKNFSKISK